MNSGLLSLSDIIQLILVSGLIFLPAGFMLGRQHRLARRIWLHLFHRSNISSRGNILHYLDKSTAGRTDGSRS